MTNINKSRERDLWFKTNVIEKIESMLHGSDSNVALLSFVVSEDELVKLKQQYSDRLKISTMSYDEDNKEVDKLIVIIEKPRSINNEHQENDYQH
jgi:hypothetical protein